MNYTMPEWILLIGAIGVMIQGIITAWKTTAKLAAVSNDMNETRRELVSVAKTTETTLGHVNSQTTKATAEIAALTAERLTLKDTIAKMDTTAALLAAALAASSQHSDRRVNSVNSGSPTSTLPPATLPVVIKEEDLPLVIQPESKKKGK